MNVTLTNQRLLTQMPGAGSLKWNDLVRVRGANLLFIAAHVPLALIMFHVQAAATAHALITFLIALRWAISKSCLTKVAYLGAYITGAEVLWRMSEARIPWEAGKYATATIFVIALFRNGRFKLPLLPLLYFALLIPAIAPTVMMDQNSIADIRKTLSFNLSGPFALMSCVWFFSHLRLTSAQLGKVLLSVIGPSTAVGVFTLFSIVTAQNINWSLESNLVSSGGFGPNQVSGALSLGALMALLYLVKTPQGYWTKLSMFVVMMFLLTQGALTFSRGGLYGCFGAALLACFYLARDRGIRLRIMLILIVTFLGATFVIVPRLESFTEGAIVDRFQDVQTAHRTELIRTDLNTWWQHPVFGVGVGESYRYNFKRTVSHTELTRLLAEHGSLGMVSLLLLLSAACVRLRSARANGDRAVIAATIGWSLLFMLDKAMRLVAPAFAFGLAFANLGSVQQTTAIQVRPNPRFATVRSGRRRTPGPSSLDKVRESALSRSDSHNSLIS